MTTIALLFIAYYIVTETCEMWVVSTYILYIIKIFIYSEQNKVNISKTNLKPLLLLWDVINSKKKLV